MLMSGPSHENATNRRAAECRTLYPPARYSNQTYKAGKDAGATRSARIIRAFFDSLDRIMEAERLNLIESNLADLARRAEELRGYL